MWTLFCFCRFAVKSTNMSDKKAVIKNADMSDDMQQDAVDYAMQAMEKFNIEKDIAAYVKKVPYIGERMCNICGKLLSRQCCAHSSTGV